MRKFSMLAMATLLSTPLLAHAADDAPRCHYVKIVDLPIRYVGRSLAPAVDATINGTPASMLLNTGNYDTTLTTTAVTRRGLSLDVTNKHVMGLGGVSRVYTTHVDELGIGPIKSRQPMDMAVFGDATFTPEYDGTLGAPFLLQMDLVLDLPAKRLKLYQPHDCTSTALLLWKEATIIIPTLGATPKNPNPHFKVLVNGHELDAVIESGAHHSYLTRNAAERAGIDVGKDPKVVRTGDVGGVGGERSASWIAPIQTIQIGDETLKSVELGVIDTQSRAAADLYLGQDFLRVHRVLFANSQAKLYLAYVGGDVFTHGTGIEPWMRREAEEGNPDAQYALAAIYGNGPKAARDPEQARTWMDKAAAAGQPNAVLVVARRQMLAGQVGAALPKLRTALDQLPADHLGPLWLYIARVRNGEAELGRGELEATLKKQQSDDWPYPIAQFYLGKWDATRVLDEAAKDKQFAHNRICQAETYIAEWHGARGDTVQAKSYADSARAHCAAPAAASKVAQQGQQSD